MITWFKQNKLASILILLIVVYFVGNFITQRQSRLLYAPSTLPMPGGGESFQSSDSVGKIAMDIAPDSRSSYNSVAPTDSSTRLVIEESNLSVLVKNVTETNDEIENFAKSIGGFMVNSSLQNPAEAATATLTIRVPQTKLKETLQFVRGKAVKVVSENLTGTDVTDQYENLEAKLETYNATKAKFEDILAKATQVQDILNVQREIINLQAQIDRLEGQQQYLEKTAALSKITIYLSTDEFALPYAPSETWRPEVIFKTAVRSLVGTLRGLGELVIWLVVYSPVWLVILIVIWFIRRRMRANSTPTPKTL